MGGLRGFNRKDVRSGQENMKGLLLDVMASDSSLLVPREIVTATNDPPKVKNRSVGRRRPA
jgi:hypothetical protein